ncbi:Sorbitol dehydrogenase [Chlorella vulgaris]
MTAENIAAVLHGIDDLRVEPFPLSEAPGKGCVRVAIKAVGICGSDVHMLKKGRIAHFVVEKPMVTGHESAGEVVAVGEGVTSLQVGDRVALEPGIPCCSSRHMREGRYNLDPSIEFFATPPVHGSLATFVDHPAEWCYQLPPGLSFEEGALCLVALLSARAFGADAIAITDLKASNLSLATWLGADAAVLIEAQQQAPQAIADALLAANAGVGFDIVIDCAGFQQSMQVALRSCVSGGKVVLVGMGQETMALNLIEACIREVDILGCFRYCNTYPLCLSLLSSGRVDLKPLITHRFGFSEEEVLQGFDTAFRADATGAIKVMFNL